jgi:hypothetical protein
VADTALGREAIYAAFFEVIAGKLLAPAGQFNYGSRRYRTLGQLGGSQYPAFFMTEVGEDYDRSVQYAPAKVSLFAHVTIQTADGVDPQAITATALNDLADAVEVAVTFSATQTGQTTLNGRVQEAWVNGRQVTTPASSTGRYSEEVMAVEMVVPRMR